MDVTTWNAIIAAAASIVAALIATATALYLYWLRKKQEERVERLNRDMKARERTAGYSVERIVFSETFDESGSGVTVLEWHGIRSRGQDIQNLKISYHSDVASPEGRIGEWQLSELERSVATFRFQEDKSKKSVRSVTGEVILRDFLLTPKSGFVGYRMVQEMTNQHLMTREAVEKAYANDKWTSEYVCYPMPTWDAEELVVIVVFPPSHHALARLSTPVAFKPGLEELDVSETKRLDGGIKYEDGKATLIVPKPQSSLRYGISWQSPRAKSEGLVK